MSDTACAQSRPGTDPRVARERRTVVSMIEVYCRHRHRTNGALCDGCQELLSYAMARLEKCPFQENKPTCAKCPIHCYQPKRREQIREVMRVAGPRMLLRHPLFTIRHYLDSLARPPSRPSSRPERSPRS